MPMYNPPHPGRIINDIRETNGWSMTQCAENLGVPIDAVSELLSGRCGITPEMARALERAGWSNAAFWLRVQASYDEAQAVLQEKTASASPEKVGAA